MCEDKEKSRTDFLKNLKASKERQNQRERKKLIYDIINQINKFSVSLRIIKNALKGFKEIEKKQEKEKMDDKNNLYL